MWSSVQHTCILDWTEPRRHHGPVSKILALLPCYYHNYLVTHLNINRGVIATYVWCYITIWSLENIDRGMCIWSCQRDPWWLSLHTYILLGHVTMLCFFFILDTQTSLFYVNNQKLSVGVPYTTVARLHISDWSTKDDLMLIPTRPQWGTLDGSKTGFHSFNIATSNQTTVANEREGGMLSTILYQELVSWGSLSRSHASYWQSTRTLADISVHIHDDDNDDNRW